MKIIPKPNKFTVNQGFVKLNDTGSVSNEFPAFADGLNDFVEKLAGFRFREGKIIRPAISDALEADEYTLTVSVDGIDVCGGSEQGLFYGLQSLKQLLAARFKDGEMILPACEISDKPRFKYRGFMLDCARHFFPVDEIKRFIAACALLKLNVFHWHLIDDQGCRFESKAFPLLTEVGSKRTESRGDGVPVEGFYTQEEMRDVVAYAKARYIDVVPEIDVPGHATALIASYPRLSCDGKPVDVATRFGILPNLVCAGKPEVYDFLYALFDEVTDIFPFEYIHIGGDESVKTHWRDCPDCQKTIADNNLKNEEQLQSLFTARIISYLADKNRKVITWNEALNSGVLDPRAVTHYWNDGAKPERVLKAVNSGRKTIISKFAPFYLDYPHGMHTLRAIYRFNPVIKGVNPDSTDNIFGVESPLWSEYIPTPHNLELKAFPRLFALAETAWTNQSDKKLREFKARLKTQVKLLDLLNVAYTPVNKSDPDPVTGLIQIIRFATSHYSVEDAAAAKAANTEMKNSRESGGE
ncbi:MAG: beta-N-acetylhexosaminidase [Clostridiaceae bacterium]|jgi:hexosaminidase|nr:beta-N-acetylhexosaminidase [Clostridiaceae bacterium]